MDVPPLAAALARLGALDPEATREVAEALSRLMRAAEATAWARERLPGLIAAGSPRRVLAMLADEAAALTGAPEVWVLAWSGASRAQPERFRVLAGRGEDPRPADLAPQALSRSVVGRALRDGRPTWSDDAGQDARFEGARSVRALSLRSVGCLPLGPEAALYLADPHTPGRFEAGARERLAALCALTAAFLDEPAPAPAPAVRPVPGLVGASPPMLELFAAIHAFAPMPWPALVLGETGTGKEAVARALHLLSPRAVRPFVAVNCGAIPDELAEATLFGHERGAYTGADRRREGLVERVGAGTLFLDEVGELSPRAQVKLLRLLQEGTFERVGGERELRFEGRVVAATHRPIDDAAQRGGFREDLFHRLAACVLHSPPLRERRADIPALAEDLLARALADLPGAPPVSLGAEAGAWLSTREWPGNVRELSNALRGAVARRLARGGGALTPEDFGARPASPAPVESGGGLEAATDAFQKERVYAALAAADGNKSRAAEALGVSRQWLHKLLARWEEGA